MESRSKLEVLYRNPQYTEQYLVEQWNRQRECQLQELTVDNSAALTTKLDKLVGYEERLREAEYPSSTKNEEDYNNPDLIENRWMMQVVGSLSAEEERALHIQWSDLVIRARQVWQTVAQAPILEAEPLDDAEMEEEQIVGEDNNYIDFNIEDDLYDLEDLE
ncbi:uncharacterized protein MELLADRAFT_112404 [Melampsora larici-populina 98AG31]|uniref:Uncharacterized protein n=1 Tax=Melampsora larici-populina (strain 98AG31 / pathotype 3-4-7) TaxID=747676 RepID=F4S6D3_MELLP|nr:uncharacterized protein MELLADRAFT_112404 [Melampsora larici-populina 98AG31]EGF99791.1 hypothetical protein MELLADRAFT_112404 [Melampsora larici-populina 98AG31]